MSNNPLIISIVIILAAIGVGIAFLPYGDNEKYDKTPDFAFEDFNGNTVTRTDLEGKVAVINSWATWCPFCVNELPDFVALQKEFGDDIIVVAISRQESRETAKNFTDSLGISKDILFLLDPKDSFYKSIGGISMPETLFIDKDGNIRTHKRGFMTLEEMREKTKAIMDDTI